jgi:flagellar protein FlbD
MRDGNVICLTRLNGSRFYLNAVHIQTVESTPDTHVLLTNGQSYVVLEPASVVADLVLAYQRQVYGAEWAPLVIPEATETGVVALRTSRTER